MEITKEKLIAKIKEHRESAEKARQAMLANMGAAVAMEKLLAELDTKEA